MQHDFTPMLLPISSENPAGDNQEDELFFDEIRRARESEPDYLPQDEWSLSAPRKADWKRVLNLCEGALREKTKDLQLVCWYVEALSHQQGLHGTEAGINFLSEFITRFWFQLWPSLEEEGLTTRRSKLLRLDKDLSQQLLHLPLLRQSISSLACWREVLAFEHKINTNPEKRDALLRQENALTMEAFEEQATHFSSVIIGQQAFAVEQLSVAVTQLEVRYASLSQAPEHGVFTQTSKILSELTDYLQRLSQLAIPLPDESISLAPLMDNVPILVEDELTRVTPKSLMNREHAIGQMSAIAAYFRHAEPSSPVPFLMERAARWATMTLPEWLDEMLSDSNSINEINYVLKGKNR